LAEFVEEEKETREVGKNGNNEHFNGFMTGIDASVTSEQAEKLTDLLKKYSDVFSRNELDLGKPAGEASN